MGWDTQDYNVLNRVPSKTIAKTLYELWIGKKASVKYLHIWGYLAKARPYKSNENKLNLRIVGCDFVGYFERRRGYKFNNLSNWFFFETDNIKFIEDNRSTKIRDISFEKESIDDSVAVSTSVTSSGMITIPYIMEVAHSVNQDIPILPLMQMKGPSA